MTLHGIKLYHLRNWTPNASCVFQLVTGIVYTAHCLVPAGVNQRFQDIVDLERNMTKKLGHLPSIADLERAWLDKLKDDI